ncbi:butyrophilin-like protein 8 isoform X1 [Octodon degus]|uniref:Butyrophilin-like protein 8 isoform X1 n=1 Tax=Octodon degus TaxID=10160 RepID=A0A6P6DCE9_OCTDE|nr:butyrophilin-like protein 8 isoform X1 [Octodon degus]
MALLLTLLLSFIKLGSALSSTPLISIMGYVDGGIELLCQSSVWLSQPIVKWKGPQGHDLSSDSKITANRHGLFDVESFFIVQENSGSISCFIQLPNQSQRIESRIWIRETFFQLSSWHLASIALGLLCFILSVGIIAVKMFSSKYMRNNLKELEWRKKQSEAELTQHQKYAVEVTLDPDTAHPQLYISDLKSVIFNEAPQDVPYMEKRFLRKCVVASQGFETGKHYWEVDVGDNESWCLGVCQDNVHRNQYETYSSNNGYWVLELKEGHKYFILDPQRVSIFPRKPLTKVGVFLDCEGRTISFFNVDDKSLIYTLTHQFEGLLRPYIKPPSYIEKNRAPIVICPVTQRPERESISQDKLTSPNTDNENSSPEATIPFLSRNDC